MSVTALAIAASILAYLLPSFVATSRKRRNSSAIFCLNLLTGWTFVGWVASLVWALKED